MSPLVGQVTMGVYALLLAAGGVFGMAKAGSRPSLIAGLVSAALIVCCLILSGSDPVIGFGLGAGIAGSLVAVFASRYRKTGKFMPSGMLLGLSAVVGLVLVAVAVQAA